MFDALAYASSQKRSHRSALSDSMIDPMNDALKGAVEIEEVTPGTFVVCGDSLSPSLWQNREEPCFELKFLLTQEQSESLEDWALQHLRLDPHARPEMGNAYHTHGLYFDTPQLDVFRRSPGYKRKKYRLRRYGSEDRIYMEQKRKKGDRVAKRRTQVTIADLQRLHAPPANLDWAGHWFHHRVALRKLQPCCQISYERKAFFGQSVDGPLRLTLDRNLRCALSRSWQIEELTHARPFLAGQVLLELKYRSHLPALFRTLVQDFSLTTQGLSKYRLAIEACNPQAMAGSWAHA